MKINVTCKCGREFKVFNSVIVKGGGKFCSVFCSRKYQIRATPWKGKIRNQEWIDLMKSKLTGQRRHAMWESTKDILRKQRLGNPLHTEEEKERISQRNKERWQNPEYRKKLSHSIKIAKNLSINVEKVRNEMIERWKNEKYKKEVSKKIKEVLNKPEYKLKFSINSKRRWADPEYKERTIKNTLISMFQRPTSFEKKIADLCIEHNLPFIYCGNGTFLIGNKSPDFINKENKVAVEVYANYWKERDYGSCEEYEKQRSEYFKNYGWKVIFISESNLKADNWKESCLLKLKEGLIKNEQ